MAEIDLVDVWLHDAADLADHVTGLAGSVAETPGADGEIRAHAGGRRRQVRRPGRRTTVQVVLDAVDPADKDRLDAWTGRLLMLRDPRGRKLWGVYHQLTITELPSPAASVTIAFEQVTVDEAV